MVPQDEPCPNLDEQYYCKIYPRKPSVCGLYPYRIDKEFGSTHYGLMSEKSRSVEQEGKIPCEGFREDAPIFFDAEPQDPTVYKRLKDRAEQAAKFKSEFKSFFLSRMEDLNFAQEVQDNCHFNSPTGKRIRLSFAEFLAFNDIEKYGLITTPTKQYIESNMNKIQEQFDKLISIKDGRYKKFCAEMQLEAINHLRVMETETNETNETN